MNNQLRRLAMNTVPVIAIWMLTTPVAADESNTAARYEDDAWYDVSEWFDGNDYNPTDEAIGRWDNETFEYYDKQTSSDNDNDTGDVIDASDFYGEDWDDGNGRYADADGDGNYESYARYHDTDGDGLNDTYATYRDTNNDGTYDDYKFSALTGNTKHDLPSSKVAQTTANGLSGKRVKISGKITERQFVKRLGGLARLINVKPAEGDAVWVDMGTGESYGLFKGDSVTALGPVVKAGQKRVLMATSIETRGKQLPIEREGRKYTGTIESTKVANVQGEKHTVAKLKTQDGKKLTVDMGTLIEKDKYTKGDKVSVTGVPVKVGDRVVLVADMTNL